MSRFNIFNQIHKALRAMLYDTSLTLQQTYFADAEEAETSLEKVRMTVDVFDEHAAHEDHFVLPAIQQYEPSLVDAFEQEHEKDHALSERIRGLIIVYHHAIKTEVKIETGEAINKAFIEFMIFNLQHMAKEETVLNKVLWRYYSDAEIMAINQRIVASIPPEETAVASAWMMRGMSNAEISGWLKAVEKNAPEAMFTQLFSIAEKELPADRFRKVLENLTEGTMVA
ncbi:MAG TPA: hemerythrin domain-containing protein [Chitinophagaceae bacterium]|nr:hemerythrin domain-containing protein [Chitinophagaceae bacterium]